MRKTQIDIKNIFFKEKNTLSLDGVSYLNWGGGGRAGVTILLFRAL